VHRPHRASLTAGHRVSLRDAIPGLDPRSLHLVTTAISPPPDSTSSDKQTIGPQRGYSQGKPRTRHGSWVG